MTGTKGVQSPSQVVVFLDDRRALLLPVGGSAKQLSKVGEITRVFHHLIYQAAALGSTAPILRSKVVSGFNVFLRPATVFSAPM